MVNPELLRGLMEVARIKLPVRAGNHQSNEEQIEDANGDMLVYQDGDLTGEQARYIAALLNAAPDLFRLAAVRLNLERDVLGAVYEACRRISHGFPGGAGPVAESIFHELQRVAREAAARNPKPAQGDAEKQLRALRMKHWRDVVRYRAHQLRFEAMPGRHKKDQAIAYKRKADEALRACQALNNVLDGSGEYDCAQEDAKS